MPRPRTYAALLRGINVGGRHRLAMATVREAVGSLGHTDVRTYIQSGNVAFRAASGAPRSDPALAEQLESALGAAAGFAVPVLVRSHAELVAALDADPFPDAGDKQLHLFFLDEPATVTVRSAGGSLADSLPGRDEVRFDGRTCYLHTPDGLGRSKLAEKLVLEGRFTARNRATVRKLAAMCAELEAD